MRGKQTNALLSLVPVNLNGDAGISVVPLAARPPLTQRQGLQSLVWRCASVPPSGPHWEVRTGTVARCLNTIRGFWDNIQKEKQSRFTLPVKAGSLTTNSSFFLHSKPHLPVSERRQCLKFLLSSAECYKGEEKDRIDVSFTASFLGSFTNKLFC